jgi:hypothetical protein
MIGRNGAAHLAAPRWCDLGLVFQLPHRRRPKSGQVAQILLDPSGEPEGLVAEISSRAVLLPEAGCKSSAQSFSMKAVAECELGPQAVIPAEQAPAAIETAFPLCRVHRHAFDVESV